MRTIDLAAERMAVLRARDGAACVWTGRTDGLVAYTRNENAPAQLAEVVLIQEGMSDEIRSDDYLMTVALAWGFNVPDNVNPADVPVFYAHEHAWYALEGDTRRRIEPVEAIDRMLTVYGDAWTWWNATARDTPQAHALARSGA